MLMAFTANIDKCVSVSLVVIYFAVHKQKQIVWIPPKNPPNVYFLASCWRKYRNLHLLPISTPVWVLLVQAVLIQPNKTKQSSLHETLLIQYQQLAESAQSKH